MRKTFLSIAVLEGFAHPDLAGAVIVIPGVVHESDSAIDCAAHDPDRLFFVAHLADVRTTQPNRGDFFSGASERASRYVPADVGSSRIYKTLAV